MVTRVFLLAALAGIVPAAATAGSPGVRAYFVGGTVAQMPAKSTAKLDLSEASVLRLRSNKTELQIAYTRIQSIEYGQNVSRRYAAAILISPVLLLSKSRKHFVTVGYTDEEGRQQALVFRVDKGDIRGVLAALEARSGRRIEYQDSNARSARRG